MKPFNRFPFQLLTFLVLPLLALLVLVAFGGVGLHQSAMHELIVRHNEAAVQGAADSLSDQIALRRTALRELASTIDNVDSSIGDFKQTTSSLQSFFDGGLALVDAEGDLLAVSSTFDAALLPDLNKDDAISLHTVPGENATSIILVQSAGAGTVLGIVSLDGLGLSDVLASLHASDSKTVYVAAADGRILYHSDPSLVGRQIMPPTAAAYSAEQERDLAAALVPVGDTGWTLVEEESWRATLGRLMSTSAAAPLVLVPGVLLAGWALWFGLRQVVRPLQSLEEQARRLAWGDFAVVDKPVGGIEEIHHLQASLRYMAGRLRAAQDGMHNYIGVITRAQEDERARLARELHDETAQALVALGYRQQMLKRYLDDDPAALEIYDDVRRMSKEIVDDLRRIVRAMRPTYLDELGLVPALRMLGDDLCPGQKASVTFEQCGPVRRLNSEQELALYRIAQEALNNVHTHSSAQCSWLVIDFLDNGEVTMTIRDDGQGFAVPERIADLSDAGHFGLMGMVERATLVGGQLKIDARPDGGTTITVRLPAAGDVPAESPGLERHHMPLSLPALPPQ